MVTLNGFLRCTNEDELAIVQAHIEEHIALTRAEEGCLTFEVIQSPDPLIWTVHEEFTDPEAFRFHQTRVRQSAWGRETKGIAREYTVQGMD
ncbi:MAG: antibiotic biosynthesis monooxygenase [Thalassococcus sp.]|uniref:putative quinol monooxygenase n=1 Tax=Thalassococcus sp. TaxID=1928858 RepID=UPI001B127816|nr:antibiotic biosynthesis monooxygenase [Thalassococcus sp.]MBO6866635.1 antibiotic biosynthesis monooxygenase [Thalassococcus sp.]